MKNHKNATTFEEFASQVFSPLQTQSPFYQGPARASGMFYRQLLRRRYLVLLYTIEILYSRDYNFKFIISAKLSIHLLGNLNKLDWILLQSYFTWANLYEFIIHASFNRSEMKFPCILYLYWKYIFFLQIFLPSVLFIAKGKYDNW